MLNQYRLIIMNRKYLLIFLSLIILSCAGYKEPATTIDCPPGEENTLQNVIKSRASFNSTNQDSLSLQLSRIFRSTINNSTEKIELIVHPVDANGNYISDMDNKNFVCEIIDSSFETKYVVPEFEFEEIEFEAPIAMAIVMDHSGSMGRQRVQTVQEEVYNFLTMEIDRRDDIRLIKYDHFVDEFPYLNQDQFKLQKNKFAIGFGIKGGGTALYDAVGNGIELLSNSRYANRILVVLTDGLENSSKKYKNGEQLADFARKNGVSLATIGFGDNIDKPLLADTLALETGGVYHQICRTEDFNVVFKDIYERMKTGYKISYELPKNYGVHNIKVKLCLPNTELKTTNYYRISPNPDSLIVVNNIFFATNSDKLNREESKESIKMIEMLMKNYPQMEVEVIGHTDSDGKAEYNADLSKRRAKAVVNELVSRNINNDRFSYSGLGESSPIANNETEEGKQLNRRVEFRILKIEDKFSKPLVPIYKTPSQTIVKF